MCIEYIYRHIRQMPATKLFTTREMLIYGTRSAVDAALHRMVKSGFIYRLARGVFVRDASCKPSLLQIVEAKARAFKVRIEKHAETLLREFRIAGGYSSNTFARSGHSSTFETVLGRVYLKGICEKKLHLIDTKVGRIIYALWYWGKQGLLSHVRLAAGTLRRTEREDLWLAGAIMPAWLNALLKHRYPQPRLVLTEIVRADASV